MLCCLFIYLFIYVACFYLNFLFFYFFFYILFKSNSRCLLGVAASCVVVFPLKLTCCVSPLAIETTRLERSHTHTHTDTHTLSRSLSLWWYWCSQSILVKRQLMKTDSMFALSALSRYFGPDFTIMEMCVHFGRVWSNQHLGALPQPNYPPTPTKIPPFVRLRNWTESASFKSSDLYSGISLKLSEKIVLDHKWLNYRVARTWTQFDRPIFTLYNNNNNSLKKWIEWNWYRNGLIWIRVDAKSFGFDCKIESYRL